MHPYLIEVHALKSEENRLQIVIDALTLEEAVGVYFKEQIDDVTATTSALNYLCVTSNLEIAVQTYFHTY